VALIVGGVLVLAAVGAGIYVLVSGDSEQDASKSVAVQTTTAPTTSTPGKTSTPSAKEAVKAPKQSFDGRRLLAPECTPIRGPRWVYPVGPPVPGLPNVVADIKSNLYEVFAIKYDCAKASQWIRKLYRLKIPVKHNGNVTVIKGPAGYYCSAYPDANGFAYAGGCQSGGGGDCETKGVSPGRLYAKGRGCKITGGKKAFGWNWNVANRRVVFAHDDKGVLHLIHVSGSDTNVRFAYLKNSYQLEVLNTSGIGYLDGFTWTPSPGWSVTRIKKVNGASCKLTPAGKIACTGSVDPPTCLCAADGGDVSIEFTAAPTKKNAGYLFGGSAAQFKVTKMTPVPYLIPGTPEEAAKRRGT